MNAGLKARMVGTIIVVLLALFVILAGGGGIGVVEFAIIGAALIGALALIWRRAGKATCPAEQDCRPARR